MFILNHKSQGKRTDNSYASHHGLQGTPRSDRGLGWNRFFALILLYGRSITWLSLGEVKIHPMRVKCQVKMA